MRAELIGVTSIGREILGSETNGTGLRDRGGNVCRWRWSDK
jgi:hypothetical protein